jgi:hypothetical protein
MVAVRRQLDAFFPGYETAAYILSGSLWVDHDGGLEALVDFIQPHFTLGPLGNIEASDDVQRRNIADNDQPSAEFRCGGTIRGSQPHKELVTFTSEYSRFSERTHWVTDGAGGRTALRQG